MTAGTQGGSPKSDPPVTIPYGHQQIDDADVEAVLAVLRSDWLTQGPSVPEFEARLCQVTGAGHAVAFSSGTSALHGACAAAGLGPGDLVATSTLSFVASANCVRFVNAEPVLVDIDSETWNISATQMPDGLDGIVAVHYAGLPFDLGSLSYRPRIVIEDAAHALGARTPMGPVGNCAQSDMCCFSFHPVKVVTTGEGGAVTTNDDELAYRLRRLRNHAIVPTPEGGRWSYDVGELGWNYRLTDMQAALGTSQLARLEQFVGRRNLLADRYRQSLKVLPVGLPPAPRPGWTHAYHLFPVQVKDRRRVYDGLRTAGIGAQVHYVPIHRHSLYGGPGREGEFPTAEKVYAGLLSLPLYPGLTEAEQDVVIRTLGSLL